MSADRSPARRPLGSAAWADAGWVGANYRYTDGTIWLGRLPDGTPVGYGDDRHVCLVSATRGGKGTSSIIPNLCLWPGPVVVVDPKGENAAVTAARRGPGSEHCEGMGQDIRVLDPFREAPVDDSFRCRLNPLDALDPNNEETIAEAARLADAIVVVRQNSDEQKFWDESAREMVKALILHVISSEEFEGQRTLATVKRLVMRGDPEGVEILRQAGRKDAPSAELQLWGNLKGNQAFDGLIADWGHTYADLVADDARQYQGVKQSVLRNLEFMDTPAIRRCTEASDFRLSDLKTKANGVSLYLCLPQRHLGSHFRWLRMMLGMVISEMAVKPQVPKCGHDVLVVMDEFAALERMEFMEKEVAQIAGYHVKLFFVVQTLSQLAAIYKDHNWETLLANCGLKMFFGVEDLFSREHVSKLIGETEVLRDVRSESDTEGESENRSEGRSQTTGTSSSRSRSQSGGSSIALGSSHTDGVNQSRTRSGGISSGTSFQRGLLGTEANEHFSNSTNYSSGETEGSSSSDTASRTETSSTGWSKSDTEGTSRTEGTTAGTSRGTSRGRTKGSSETVQARPLVAGNDIGRMFARIDKPDDPAFPGLALALLSGQPPVVVRRTNYFEDYQFIRFFNPHPDHRFNAAQRTDVNWEGLNPYLNYFQLFEIRNVASTGQVVAAGERVLQMQASGAPLHVLSPRHGRLQWGQSYLGLRNVCETVLQKEVSVRCGAALPGAMLSVWHYGDAAAVNPFEEFAAAQRAAEERERAVRVATENEARKRRVDEDIAAQTLAMQTALKRWWAVLAAIAGVMVTVGSAAFARGAQEAAAAVIVAGGLSLVAVGSRIARLRAALTALRTLQATKTAAAAFFRIPPI